GLIEVSRLQERRPKVELSERIVRLFLASLLENGHCRRSLSLPDQHQSELYLQIYRVQGLQHESPPDFLLRLLPLLRTHECFDHCGINSCRQFGIAAIYPAQHFRRLGVPALSIENDPKIYLRNK